MYVERFWEGQGLVSILSEFFSFYFFIKTDQFWVEFEKCECSEGIFPMALVYGTENASSMLLVFFLWVDKNFKYHPPHFYHSLQIQTE